MAESILQTIKRMIGPSMIANEYDTDLVVHINSVLFDLTQLGVGPRNGFFITGDNETWQDFIGDVSNLEAIKSFIYLKVKMMFDPPTVGGIIDAYQKLIKEYEWRINVMVDPGINRECVPPRPKAPDTLVVGETVDLDKDRFKDKKP